MDKGYYTTAQTHKLEKVSLVLVKFLLVNNWQFPFFHTWKYTAVMFSGILLQSLWNIIKSWTHLWQYCWKWWTYQLWSQNISMYFFFLIAQFNGIYLNEQTVIRWSQVQPQTQRWFPKQHRQTLFMLLHKRKLVIVIKHFISIYLT